MASVSLAELNLELAWRRVKWDLRNRAFVTHAYHEELIESALNEWLEQLRESAASQPYSAKPCEICSVPKPGFHIRPGALLALEDHVVYCAVLQEMYPKIREQMMRRKEPNDYAYLLAGPDDIPWFQQPPFRGWRKFQSTSLERIEEGRNVVLFADIAGFYENVDLQRLKYVLKSIGIANELIDLLFACLWTWAEPRGRGIPQGHSASDLLGKVYLDSIDRRLERDGYNHIRYVDDIRIFCSSRLEAKRALVSLSALLREVGLNLGTAKTEIHDGEEARRIIEGKITSIQELNRSLLQAVREEGFADPYLKADTLDELEPSQLEVAGVVLETAFRQNFLDGAPPDFDSSLLHFLLRRLRKVGSDVAVEYSVELLSARPDETQSALDYLAAFLDRADVADSIIGFACSDEAIYEYQTYLILKWLLERRVTTDDALQFARSIVADRSHPVWLRSYGFAFVGQFGDPADLEAIEAQYPAATGDLERAIMLCSLRRMSSLRRNSAYGRYGGDSFLSSVAVGWARQSHA